MNGGTSAYASDSLYYDSSFLSAVLFVHACQPLTKHSLLLTMSQCTLRTDSRRDARRERERERERERRRSGRGRDARKIYQPLCDFSARPQITRPPVVPRRAAVWVYVHDEYTFLQEHRRPRRWLILSQAREGRAVPSGSTFDWVLS